MLLWEVNGMLSGTFRTVETKLDGNWLKGSLEHFSRYVLASK